MKTVALGEVATIERNSATPASMPPETRYLGLEHIERGGRILGASTVGAAELASAKFKFTADHVLFGKLRPNLAKIARPDFAGVCSTDILPIRPGPNLDRAYLAHFLAQPDMVEFAAARTSGANLPRLSPGVLATFPIPLPSLDEQRRIAAILDRADALRAKRRQVLFHLASLTQSIFHDMFGDPDDAPNEILFGNVATLLAGRNLVHDDAAAISPFRVLKISAVTSGQFQATESKPLPSDYNPPMAHLIQPGDLLMSRANTTALVGAVAYVPETPPNLALPDKVWKFAWHDSRSVPLFYHALFSSPTMRRRISRLASGTGGSMKNISKANLERLSLPRVDYARQETFATRARSIASAQGEATRALKAQNELAASLQAGAFQGVL